MALSFRFFGWFAAGAAFYSYWKNRQVKWFLFAIFVAILSAVAVRDFSLNMGAIFAALSVSALFSISIQSSAIQAILGNRFLQFFGFISYPLYLIHENMMISIIIKSGDWAGAPGFLLVFPILAIGFLAGIAFFVAKYFEPWLKILLTSPTKLLIMRK